MFFIIFFFFFFLIENEKEVSASQFGYNNSIIIKDSEQTIYLEQFGNDNKLIVQLEDRTQPRLLELKSSGKGQDCNDINLHFFSHGIICTSMYTCILISF